MTNRRSGWLDVTIGDLIQGIEAGKNFRCIERPPEGDEKGVVKVSAVSWGRFLEDESKTVPPSVAVDERARICVGDLLMSRANTVELVGACVRVEHVTRPLYLSDKVLRLQAEPELRRWLHRYLSSPSARKLIADASSGNQLSMRNISQKAIAALPCPLPPLNEQKRIADKLDKVLARVEACRERLDRVPAILKRFRQAVLATATSGTLTEDWRGGSELAGWDYRLAADVCAKVQSGGTPKDGFSDDGIPFLKVYNIVDQKVCFDAKPQFLDPTIHQGQLAKSQTRPGDVLMNIVGPPLGKVAIVPDTFPEWNINQAITLFRPSPQITSKWLYLVLCRGENIAEIVHETRGSAGQVNISLSQCRSFVFPVPPVDEQREIVRRVETLFARADRLEARLKAAREQTDRLTPALLAKAFRGELVPQDPADEPATELLERVLQSKTTAGPGMSRRVRHPAVIE